MTLCAGYHGWQEASDLSVLQLAAGQWGNLTFVPDPEFPSPVDYHVLALTWLG